MATNLSVFPDQIDVFITHSDVGSTDLANVSRYQELRVKDSLTSAESDEMATLFSMLREKIWTAEDLNKLQDSITNLETFFKYQTEVYISDLFAQYDERMANIENRIETLVLDTTRIVDDKIAEANEKIADVIGTRDEIVATIYDSQYFNFDNLCYRAGYIRKTEKISDTVTVETIYNATDETVYATRTTTKNADKDYTVVTVCELVVPAVNVTVHTYKDENDNWIEDVTDNTVASE